ncbi:hypothetical protein [Peribacillus simplex]|uniref:hypothetical protein n=1 Tax=Peribacillus simplex TaxID=1478 RepID=UPI0016289BFE|nr:hypothetical protein [Peribacillus simplex]
MHLRLVFIDKEAVYPNKVIITLANEHDGASWNKKKPCMYMTVTVPVMDIA